MYKEKRDTVLTDTAKKQTLQARHILMGTKLEAMALLPTLTLSNFGHKAREFSMCDSHTSYGILPPWQEGMMVEAFHNAVAAAPLNEIVGPVLSEKGWHFIIRTR